MSPASATLSALDATVQLTAEVRDQNGQPLTDAIIDWESSADSVAVVDSSGLVRAAGNGEAFIAASMSVGTAAPVTSAITVRWVVGTVSVSPSAQSLTTGDTVRLAAEGFDGNGHAVRGAVFSWSSSDSAVAMVDTLGLVTAAQPGAAVISAASGSAKGYMELDVLAPEPISIYVTPAVVVLAVVGDSVRLVSEVRDLLGRVLAPATVYWSSSHPAVATVDSTGLVRGTADGVATISAQTGYAGGASHVAVGNQDRAALTRFYDATDGANWSRRDNWLTDAPLAEWHGLGVDARGRVSQLSLASNNIGGRITGGD
ncbi:Ig-like domain-containing protein [Candidatus Palauibacter sp.]|uniref:Ig-like domain-containing protein n=1 Tax=Candidatus Palauibacter sp. TaxID=3101350 RepID=UPI003B52F351